MKTQITQILIEARALLEKPNAWIQGDWAKDAAGNPISPFLPGAVCFCAEGALDAVTKDLDKSRRIREWVRDNVLEGNTLMGQNDKADQTQEGVLAIFDKAINEATRTAGAA